MIGVVDTSALIRLYIPDGPMPDGFEGFLRGVERGENSAIAPELMAVEAANVLHKKQWSGELSEDECGRLLSELLSLPIRLFRHRPLLLNAFQLASKHRLTVCDILYLALAAERGAVLFTADHKLAETAAALRLI
jgi:predicted nucleic acid-binding protein